MKKIIGILLTIVMMVGLCSCGGENTEKEYTTENPLVFRVAHVEATDSIMHQSLEKWKDYVEEESEGIIKVELYPNGELGGDEDVIESIQADTINMTIASSSTLTPYDPRLALLDLPFLFKDAETMDQAIRNELGDLYASWMDEAGFYCVGFQYDGARGVSNSIRPVESLKDMEGLKIRVMENDMYINMFEALGANPTPMSFNDLYTGLQQGTVDGQDNSAMLTYVNKFYEVQDYYTSLETVFCNAVIITSKAFMESLPEDLFNIIQEGADEYLMDYQRETAFAAEEEYLQLLNENGCTVTYIEDKSEFEEAVEPVYEIYREQIGEDVIDEVIEYASKYEQ